MLGRAVARLREDERVVALVLGGSLARGAADPYSDVDLYVVVRDAAFDAALAERDAIAGAVGSTLFAFDVDPVPGGSTDRIVVYEGPDGFPVKFDFMYLEESDLEPAPKWAGCAVLEDEGGRVGAVVARSEGLAPPPPKPEELRELNQKFWTWSWYVFGKIVRGELWEALAGLHDIRSLALVPLVSNLAWGLFMLIGFPQLLYPLSLTLLLVPDLGYLVVVSGAVALSWGIVRTVLAYLALRQSGTPKATEASVPKATKASVEA